MEPKLPRSTMPEKSVLTLPAAKASQNDAHEALARDEAGGVQHAAVHTARRSSSEDVLCGAP